MSKYIRTKDRILEYPQNEHLKQFVRDDEVACFKPKGGYLEWQKIIKQADSIEELCDRFVIIDFDISCEPKFYYKSEINNIYNLKNWKISNILYGAIWTDKGLIYVAKMNKEGELELI